MEQINGRVPNWVRFATIVGLAVPQLITGAWAVLGPESWYDNFPGVDPRLVAAEPPFNAHLATDAGAGFLATGLALAVAAWLAHRGGLYVALVAYFGFALPHAIYHTANPAPGLSGLADVMNSLALFGGVAFAVFVAWGARPRPLPAD